MRNTAIETMKDYLRKNNLVHLVSELVKGLDMDVDGAIEYVYDSKTLSEVEFAKKYLG